MGRMDKVNALIKREIALILKEELQDPRFDVVTVTQVDVSPDLHNAKVRFSVLGEQQQGLEAAKVLNSISHFVRRAIGKRVTLRFIPEFEFVYDPSINYSAKIDKIFTEIHNLPKSGTTPELSENQ